MWVRHLRLWAGLLLAAFVIPHVINHALGLVYLQVMEAMRQVLAVIWQGPPGGWILLAAFLTHFFLALFALFSRSTLRMPLWEGVQIALGLLIFPLILVHVIGTAVVGELLKFDPTYEYVITSIWVAEPIRGVQQTFMMVIVWGHVCMGLNFWLRLKDWYRKWVPVFVGAAILIPELPSFDIGIIRTQREQSPAADSFAAHVIRCFRDGLIPKLGAETTAPAAELVRP
jgi:adenylate cyclase